MQEQECCAAEARAWSSQAQQGAGAGPQPTQKLCHAQSLALWFGLERVKHIRSNCLLRRQKSALTSNIEAPRDTTEEFPLAGVCGKPYIKCQGHQFAFLMPVTERAAAPSWHCISGKEQCRQTKWCMEEKQANLSPCSPAQQWPNHSGETLT